MLKEIVDSMENLYRFIIQDSHLKQFEWIIYADYDTGLVFQYLGYESLCFEYAYLKMYGKNCNLILGINGVMERKMIMILRIMVKEKNVQNITEHVEQCLDRKYHERVHHP